MLSDVELNELAELYSKATPGPWSVYSKWNVLFLHQGEDPKTEHVGWIGFDGKPNAKADAAAIAALFNAFPSLAATIRASEARIGELSGCLDGARATVKALQKDWDEAIAQRDAALAGVERLKGGLDRIRRTRVPYPTGYHEDALGIAEKLLEHSDARPSTPAPDRGVPGQKVSAKHMFTGERGKHVISGGITIGDLYRNLHDRLTYARPEVEFDIDALCQQFCCAVEEHLGIFPNVESKG